MPYEYDYNEILGRRTPAESAMAGMSQSQNWFAKQIDIQNAREKQLEQNKLSEVMQDQDWRNPDVGKIIAVAPKIAMDYLKGLNQLNTNQRLLATEKARQGMEYLDKAVGRLYSQPEARQEVIDSGIKLGISPEVFTVLPQYNGDPDAWRKSLGVFSAAAQTWKGIADTSHAEILQKTKQDEMAAKLEYIRIKTGADVTVANIHQATEAVKKLPPGKSVLFQTDSGDYNVMMADSMGRSKVQPVPKELGIPYEKPFSPPGSRGGAGKGVKDTGPGISTGGRRQPGGAVAFKPGTYKDSTGNLHYITTQEQFDELNK